MCAIFYLEKFLNRWKGVAVMGLNETLKAISDPARRDILSMIKGGRKSAG